MIPFHKDNHFYKVWCVVSYDRNWFGALWRAGDRLHLRHRFEYGGEKRWYEEETVANDESRAAFADYGDGMAMRLGAQARVTPTILDFDDAEGDVAYAVVLRQPWAHIHTTAPGGQA